MPRLLALLVVCPFAFGSLAHAGPPAEKAVESSRSGQNVLVTIVLRGPGDAGAPDRTYRLVAADGGTTASLFVGRRVPIPATTFHAPTQGGEAVPYTSYTYQSVGFNAEVRARVLGDGRIRLDGQIEDSAVTGMSGDRPDITAEIRSVSAVLADGRPLEVSRLETADGSGRVMELRADLLGD